jgi:putative salt-induced outer membrane protein YdiY
MKQSILLLLLFSWPLAAQGAVVDAITLKDGSILKGEILRVEDDELILDTDYADEVSIELDHIVGIESKQHFTVRLTDGEKISGYLAVADGRIIMRETLPVMGEPEARATSEESEVGEQVPDASPPPADSAATEGAPDAVPPESEAIVAEAASERAFAFDDVSWIREKPTYYRYEAELNIGAQAERGNSDTTDLHLDALFKPSFGWNTIKLAGEYDKKVADDETSTNRWRASAAYEREIRRRWYLGIANTYEQDKEKDLLLRIVGAAGVGYRFFDEDPTHLSVLPGFAYVIENFEASSDDRDYPAFRWTLDFTRDLYKDDVSLYHEHRYLNSLKTFSDINLETTTGIEMDLFSDFTLAAEFQLEWDNKPAEDAKKTDTRYMLKIGYEFEGDENDWWK